MPAVSNTSPILNLAIIGQLELLPQQLGQVLIPPAVVAEFRLEAGLSGCGAIRHALESSWLQVVEVGNTALTKALAMELDGARPRPSLSRSSSESTASSWTSARGAQPPRRSGSSLWACSACS